MTKNKFVQALNFLSFNLGSVKPITGPFKLQMELTHRCNSRCPTCGFWQEKKHDEDMSTEECLQIIREAAKINVFRISFTGGEPLLRKDLFQLVRFAKQQGLKVNINTNALLLWHYHEKIIASGVDSLAISLDAPIAKIHDKNRGLEGAFEKTIKGIKKIIAYEERPKILICMTLNKNNCRYILAMVNFCKKLGIDYLAFEPAHSINEYWNCPDEMKMSSNDISEMEKQMELAIEEGNQIVVPPFSYYRQFGKFLKQPEYLRKFRATAGYFFATITANGDLYSSPVIEKKIGNLKKDSLINLFFSKKFMNERKRIKSGKHLIHWFNSTGPFDMSMYHLRRIHLKEIFNIVKSKRY